MATYIVIGNYTDQGVRNIKDTLKRVEALKGMAKAQGAQVKEVYWTLGGYDVVTIIEAPDDMAMSALVLSIGGAGNVRTQTLRAFSPEEITKILGRIA